MTDSVPGSAEYWDGRYQQIGAESVSWFQPSATLSLRLIAELQVPASARVVDVGGGASVLVDELIAAGFQDVTVVDISNAALATAQARVGAAAKFVQADITTWHPAGSYDLWHDRAVFHFLTAPADQARYWQLLRDHLAPGGHLVLGTFAVDGPEMCSGLPVCRYDLSKLGGLMADDFEVLKTELEVHHTPSGGEQRFHWLVARRLPTAAG